MPTPRSEFPDHFSDRASAYAEHRPHYPVELARCLASLAPSRELAWDVGCGSGQISVLLASEFRRVVATDASSAQLAHAESDPRVEYRCEPAESSSLASSCVDVVVCAQSAHWLDLRAFYGEVRRVARPGGIVALVSYGAMRLGGELDEIVGRFYSGVLGPHWPAERAHVENGYRGLPFEFAELPAPELEMRASWTLEHLLGYVDTWSAVRSLERGGGREAVAAFSRELREAWGGAGEPKSIRWPLSLRLGRQGDASKAFSAV